ncbi:hypothetical protein H4R33_000256 [Dimargaris cristalligena]|nr:hypothetical protein H4R33_000256 [Dimargaris cristalligena]
MAATEPLPPFVQYHCPCYPLQLEPKADPANGASAASPETPADALTEGAPVDDEPLEEDGLPYDPLSDDLLHHTHPLCDLYFCEDCLQLRCGGCVFEEIASYYCPSCLFEVPSASVKAEKNRCARNCFECPRCFHNLLVVEDTDQLTAPPFMSSTASSPREGSVGGGSGGGANSPPVQPYYLQCTLCRWSSRDIGMAFEKQTGLAGQMQKLDQFQAPLREFDHLKSHLESMLRTHQAGGSSHRPGAGSHHSGGLGMGLAHGSPHPMASGSGSSSAALLASLRFGSGSDPRSSSGLYSSSTRGLTALNQPGTDASSGPPTYEALHHSPEDDDMVNELMNLRTVDDIATVAQRVRQSQAGNYLIRQHAPQRVALRSKRSKRCRGCRHILIKPEQKAQVTRFKIKFIAMNFVPTITIVRNPILYTPQRRHRCAIRFVNPQYHETRIQLAIPDDYPNRLAQVTILAPSFDVSAYNDIWEYDQNQDGGDDGGSDQDSIDGLDGDDDVDYDDDPEFQSAQQASGASKFPEAAVDYGDGPDFLPPPTGTRFPLADYRRKRQRQKRLLTTGIYDRKANETAIVLEVTPLQPVPNLIIPLHVSFNYTLDNLTDDEGSVSDSEPDSKAAAGRTDGGSATAKAKGKPNLPRRECGFWTYLNLGRVEQVRSL